VKALEEDIVRKERVFALCLLIFIFVFTIVDILEDLNEGSTVTHVASEILVVLACLGASIYLWRRVATSWKAVTATMQDQLAVVRKDAKKWELAHATLSKGLVEEIDAQLNEWGLSGSEKDITFLIMKGLSFKEIANIRTTNEHTVRQQAATIYRKSGLEGRSQLTAFFLEDLLSPRS